MSVKDWAITEGGNNTTLGVTLTEGATPYANMNNAVRQAMADVRLEVASFGTVVAAASAPDIAIDGQVHSVSGSTTISAFATAPAGVYRVLYFETAVTLANTSLLTLPGAANITMSAGDKAGMRSLGSGYWTMEWKTQTVTALTGSSLSITSSSAGTLATLTSTEAGATSGPDLVLHRDSASPANSDLLGAITFRGEDDGSNATDYGRIVARIADVTGGSEDGVIDFYNTRAGSEVRQFSVGDGILMEGVAAATGQGTINAMGLYVDGDPAAGPVYIIQDRKSSGTNGGGITSGAWRTHTLNTEVLDEIGITTTTNVMALAAGTYKASFWAAFYATDVSQCRLQDTTNATTLGIGNNIRVGAANGGISAGHAYFVLSGAANVELQVRVSTTNGTDGGGQATSWGTEVYASVYLEKVA